MFLQILCLANNDEAIIIKHVRKYKNEENMKNEGNTKIVLCPILSWFLSNLIVNILGMGFHCFSWKIFFNNNFYYQKVFSPVQYEFFFPSIHSSSCPVLNLIK